MSNIYNIQKYLGQMLLAQKGNPISTALHSRRSVAQKLVSVN
jgi:hypothetical protein